MISITVSTLTIRLNQSTCDVYSSLVECQFLIWIICIGCKATQVVRVSTFWERASTSLARSKAQTNLAIETVVSESLRLEMYFSKNPTMNLPQLNIFTELFNIMFRIPGMMKTLLKQNVQPFQIQRFHTLF